MKQPRAIANINKQSQTTPPFTNDSTLVDDTVIIVDSTTALSGGPVSISPNIPLKVVVKRYYPSIKKRR